MIQKKRELHLSYSQAFGVARKTDKFRPRYSAGVHLISVLHLLIAKFREYCKHPTPMTIQLHPQCLLGIQGILRNWTFLIFKQV